MQDFEKGVSDVQSRDVIEMMMITQYFDMLKVRYLLCQRLCIMVECPAGLMCVLYPYRPDSTCPAPLSGMS